MDTQETPRPLGVPLHGRPYGYVTPDREAREPTPHHNLDHPYFARERPRSMLIDEMEATWAPIAERDDWSLFEATPSAGNPTSSPGT